MPAVDGRLLTLLGLVSLAIFFEQYDASMLTAALKHIAFDLGIAEDDLGPFLGVIRLGALPALLLVPFADRFGRRRVFLVAVIGFSFGTMASGLAMDAYQAFHQLSALLFLYATPVLFTALLVAGDYGAVTAQARLRR